VYSYFPTLLHPRLSSPVSSAQGTRAGPAARSPLCPILAASARANHGRAALILLAFFKLYNAILLRLDPAFLAEWLPSLSSEATWSHHIHEVLQPPAQSLLHSLGAESELRAPLRETETY
jgi:hypothetical protein